MWIEYENNWYNLDCFSNIWLERDANGLYFMMGKMTKNGEERVLSQSFKHKDKLISNFWK